MGKSGGDLAVDTEILLQEIRKLLLLSHPYTRPQKPDFHRNPEEDRGFLGISRGDSLAMPHRVRAKIHLMGWFAPMAAEGKHSISPAYPPRSELPQPQTPATALEPFMDLFAHWFVWSWLESFGPQITSCGRARHRSVRFLRKKGRVFCLV